MKKEDFLEILRDYLKKGFSEDEVMDILRDYEEYFVDGIIEGKSEIEIIQSLGSPKEIANSRRKPAVQIPPMKAGRCALSLPPPR